MQETQALNIFSLSLTVTMMFLSNIKMITITIPDTSQQSLFFYNLGTIELFVKQIFSIHKTYRQRFIKLFP